MGKKNQSTKDYRKPLEALGVHPRMKGLNRGDKQEMLDTIRLLFEMLTVAVGEIPKAKKTAAVQRLRCVLPLTEFVCHQRYFGWDKS